MPLQQFPRFPLAHTPTPLEPLERMQKFLGGPHLYIKRDDCTGLALGGNKTRKLEFLVGEALTMGATTIISEGGLQSNHVRQTAAAAAKAGLRCHLVLNHAVPIDTAIYRTGGNLLLDRLLGAVTHFCAAGETRAAKSAAVAADLQGRGEVPYRIPTGGSNAVGALGYAALMLELLQQAKELQLSFDKIVVASASGGTQAGLVVGRELAQADLSVMGIDVEGDPDDLLAMVQSIAGDCARKVGLRREIRPDAFELVRGYAAPGYGLPSPGTIEAIKSMASLEGILLDPVYTGKAMAGLIDMARTGRLGKDDTVLFIHTGGMPALFAYADRF
jgi:D-cysteine desulfhydrase family pyridoxal phosphate-dependent enzyme